MTLLNACDDISMVIGMNLTPDNTRGRSLNALNCENEFRLKNWEISNW